MEIAVGVIMFVVGAMMGSFACCQAWRIRKKDKSARSHCMKCDHVLKWYEMIPIVSWIGLRGRCRKCGGKIGAAEVLAEVVMGVVFGVVGYGVAEAERIEREVGIMSPGSGWWWGAMGVVLLLLSIGLCILFIYDAKWRELPVRVLVYCVACGVLLFAIRLRIGFLYNGSFLKCGAGGCVLRWEELWGFVMSFVGALLILPGLYYVLYKVSGEKWMGGGDWIVALVVALVVQDWWLALCVVFVANFMGAVVGLIGKKKKMAFGPYLIVGMAVVLVAQEWLVSLIG